MRSLLLAGTLMVFAFPSANAWTIRQSFDGQVDGDRCEGWSSTQSTVTSAQSHSGGKACKLIIGQAETGFGKWGGIVVFPSSLVKGQEFWVRVRTFMPDGFNYDSTSEGSHLKFLRLHTRTPAVSNSGYNDWYINPKAIPTPSHKFIYEGEQRWDTANVSGTQPVLGVWETYEMYIRLDTRPANSAGMALVRMWKNGSLIKETKDRFTLTAEDGYADRFHFFTYWNGGSPQTQEMYVDDIVLTSDVPAGRDALGNPFVGLGGTVPQPPVVVVQ